MEEKVYNIEAIRGELSQEEFAAVLGISRELVSKMETGKLKISKSTKILLDKFESEKNTKKMVNPLNEEPQKQGPTGNKTINDLIAMNLEIIRTHSKMVDSHYTLVQAEKKHADTISDLVSMQKTTVDSREETELSGVAKFAELMRILAEVGSGKLNWNSTEEGLAELHRRVYGMLQKNPITDKKPEEDSSHKSKQLKVT